MIDYTLVCGVDQRHLDQLCITWPTWKKYKPSLLQQPMVIFYDKNQVIERDIRAVVNHPDLMTIPWPLSETIYGDDKNEKWTEPQRVKMITGFVFASALGVRTKYWLKLDTDVVASGQPDWIDPEWFADDPAIVCPPWGFTRPPHQMLDMDAWVAAYSRKRSFQEITKQEPLNLHPEPGADRVHHRRICSWCGFFKSSLSRLCVKLAEDSIGYGAIPSPSQDGYMWYVAKRMGFGIRRIRMKDLGWSTWSNRGNLIRNAEEALNA